MVSATKDVPESRRDSRWELSRMLLMLSVATHLRKEATKFSGTKGTETSLDELRSTSEPRCLTSSMTEGMKK